MMQKVEFIAANKSHISAIAEIARRSFPDPWSETVFSQTLQNQNNTIWCAMLDNRIYGYLVLSRSGDNMSVDDIAVHPDFRRQGIAKLLLVQAHRQFPDAEFWLEVRASNTAAIALYTALGYVQVGLRKRYYLDPIEDAVLMTRFKDVK